MKFGKRLISVILALCTMLTTVSGLSFSAQAKEKNVESVDCSSNVSVESDYEAFDIFSDAVNEVKDDSVTEVNNISRITFSEKTATVNLKTTINSTLLVGVYTEDEKQLLAVGTKKITSSDTEVTVDVSITSMPQYFVAKGYIVDSTTMKPISTVYTCTFYTKDMQELFKSNIDSYDRERVINFDDSYNNNFAVYNADVIQEPTSEITNVVVSDDDNTCVVNNASNNIKNLKKGDVLALGSNIEDIIYLKVLNISVEGNSVTITKDKNIEVTDVFEWVKISNNDDLYSVEKMSAKEQKSYSDISVCASNEEIDDKGSDKQTKSTGEFSGSAKAVGKLTLTLTLGFDFFVVPSKLKDCYISLYLDYNLQFNFNVTVKGSANFNKMPHFSFGIAGGVLVISAIPNIKVDFELEINLEISYAGRVGMKLDIMGKFTNLTQSPTLKGKLTAEGVLKVDFSLELSLRDCFNVVKGYITPHLILTAKAKLDNSHKCTVCFAGDLSYDFNMDYGIVFFSKYKHEANVKIRAGEICKFYYSATTGKFGIGKCPNVDNGRLRTLRVIYDDGSPARYANVKLYKCDCVTANIMHRFYGLSHYKVVGNYKADKNGIVKFYLDAEENGYKCVLEARSGILYGRYFFPWYGETNNYTYPITLNHSDEAKSYSINNVRTNTVSLNDNAVTNYSVDKSEDSNGVRTLKYTDLTPNEKYNFYSLTKSTNGDSDDLTSSTILYLQQYVADEKGELTVTFTPNKTVKSPVDCLLAMGQDDISVADIKQLDITCKSDENNVYPYVSVYGRMLLEGRDYTLEGDVVSSTAGEHTFYVVGMGNYKGKVACKYKSTLYKDEYINVCEKAQILIGKSYYTQKSKDILKNTVEGTKDKVSTANDQTVVDSAVNEINQKIDELVLIDHFEDSTKDGVKFEWNKEDQSLTIFGTGNITAPCDWDLLKNNVKVLVIKNVTNIENGAFSDYKILNSVSFDSNIKSVSKGAFSGCENLTDVYYVRNSNEWRNVVSAGETGLENATVHCSFECVPNGHTWGEWKYNNDAVYNSPTDYKNGTQTRICTTCGENETVEAPNTGLLRINTVSLSLESSITMNFKVFKNSLSSFDDFYMTFECGGKEEKVTNYKQDGNYYVFSYKGINPQLMNDKVTAVLHAKNSNGENTSPEKVMSVREYAYTMLDRYSSDEHSKLRTLLVDLLNYGSATQKYVGYQTDNLANSDLTATQKSWASKDTKEFKNIRNFNYKTISNPTVQWNSCGLVLGNAIMFKVKFTANSVENKTVEITLRNAKFTYDKNDFKDNGDGTYYVYCNELFAHEVSDEVLLTVYENGVPCSNTMRFSVESYARLVRDNYKGTPLDEMITTMMLYGNSAKEYKNV